MVKSTMTGTVTSSGRGGTAAAMAQNEQTRKWMNEWNESAMILNAFENRLRAGLI